MTTLRRTLAWRTLGLLLLAPLLAAGQAAETDVAGVLHGTVLSAQGEPISEARVRMTGRGLDAGRVATAISDDDAAWQVDGLTPGIWDISVDAPGYSAAVGKVEVSDANNPALEVVLEVDSAAAVAAWIEQANELSAAGSYAAAQAFYDQAVTVVPWAQAGALHRALALTYYRRDRLDDAVSALQTALLIDPGDSEARTLLTAALEADGQADVAAQWLRTLDSEGVPSAGRAAFGLEIAQRDLPRRPTGRFRTGIDAASPASDLEQLLERGGGYERLGLVAGEPWDPAAESFEVYVPPGDTQEEPYGLLVWISPTPRGSPPDEDMLQILDERRVIWIGANQSGNSRAPGDRARLALDAAHAISETYPVDAERVYVGGYSGGGRMASQLAIHYPEVFTGGLYFMGVSFYRDVPVPHQPGILWGASISPPSARALEIIRQRSRFVFITGTHDFNGPQTRAYLAEYERDGISRATYIEIRDAGHYYGFRRPQLAAALEALDSAATTDGR